MTSGWGMGRGTPKKLRKEEVGLQSKQLILFLNKPPVIPADAGKRKPKRRENGFENQ